jgi:O-antigen/teichoic acid export membrane protein
VARALDRFDLHNAYGLLQGALTLAGLLAALFLLDGALEAALVVFMAVQLVLALAFGVRVARLAGFEPRFDAGEAGASLRYGANLHFQNICIHLHERVDLFLLAALGTSVHDVGLYAAAVSVVAPLRLPPPRSAPSPAPKPAGVRRRRGRRVHGARGASDHAGDVRGAIAIPCLGVRDPLLFGREYEGAVASFLFLTPGMAALALSRVLALLRGGAPAARCLLLRAASLAANVALNFALIPRHGIVGAALASLLVRRREGRSASPGCSSPTPGAACATCSCRARPI